MRSSCYVTAACAARGPVSFGETLLLLRLFRGEDVFMFNPVLLFSSGDGGYARDARLKAPSSLAVAPNGTLYIADLGNIRIRAVNPNQPQPGPAGLVEISSPQDQELYLFSQVRRGAPVPVCKQSSTTLVPTGRLESCLSVEKVKI